MKITLHLRIAVAILFLIPVLSLKAQPVEEWVARYNGPDNKSDNARKIAIDDQGNVYVTGRSAGKKAGAFYVATVKYNSVGVQQWVARYTGPANQFENPSGLVLDAAGNVYVTTASEGNGSLLDIATIKYNSNGGQQWVTRYNGTSNLHDVPGDMVVDDDGNVFVTGLVNGSYQNMGSAIVLIKYNSGGGQDWVRFYDHLPNDNSVANKEEGESLALDSDGNIFITGISGGMVTLKYSSTGGEVWSRAGNVSRGQKVLTDATGNVVATGSGNNYLTIKYDTDGNVIWESLYPGLSNGEDAPYDMALNAAGDVYVTGFGGGPTSSDFATLKYNGISGAQIWVSRYNGVGSSIDIARGIVLDQDGNAYVTGYTTGKSGRNLPVYYGTIRYSSSAGAKDWEIFYKGPDNGGSHSFDIAVDLAGNVYVTGESASKTGADYATIKYSQGSLARTIPNTITSVANELRLKNYPNPSNKTTTIEYNLPVSGLVKLDVYNLEGKLVSNLVNGKQSEGRHFVNFQSGNLPASTYVYRIQTGGMVQTRKLIIVK